MSEKNKNKTAMLRSIIPNPLGENAKPIPLNTLTNANVQNIANERALQALTIATQIENDRIGYAENMSGLTGVRKNMRHDPTIIRSMNYVQQGPKKRTQLMFAAMNGDIERVKELLRSGPWSLYLEDSDGNTALYWAAGKGHEDIVKILLEAKSDNEPMPGYLEKALYNATDNGHISIMRILIEAGANLNNWYAHEFGYDIKIKKMFESAKKIGKFMMNVKSKKNTLRNAWAPPNNNSKGGNAYQALLSKQKGVFNTRKSRKSRKLKKSRKSRK
jgi:hypothetical protein